MITEEKSSLFEGVTAGLGVVIVFISTLSAPRLSNNMTRVELARQSAREAKYLANLQTTLKATQEDNGTLRVQLAEAGSLLEKARLQMTTLIGERDTLEAKVAATTSQLQDMEGKYQALNEQMAQFNEVEVCKERDAAFDRAKKAEDRIRELTLQLNRAGIWP